MPTYSIIPNATDQISQSQSQIQTNFASIKSLIDVNHVDFSDGVNFGKHYAVTFPVQLAANLPTFLSGEVALYNMLPTAQPTTGVDELFINKIVSGGAAVQIPMTASILSTSNAPGFSSSGWSYLPSGILLKWGTFNATQNQLGTVTYTFGSNIPVFTQVFTVQCIQTFPSGATLSELNDSVTAGNYTTTTFQIFPRANGLPNNHVHSYTYLAIGY
jgi:hypothetical protein